VRLSCSCSCCEGREVAVTEEVPSVPGGAAILCGWMRNAMSKKPTATEWNGIGIRDVDMDVDVDVDVGGGGG